MCSKSEYRAHAVKIDPSPTLHKNHSCVTIFTKLCLWTAEEIKEHICLVTVACSRAETQSLCLKI